MRHAVISIGYLNLVVFTVLAVAAVRQWRTRRSRAAFWVAIAFATLGFVVLTSRAVPTHPELFVEKVLLRLEIVALVLFPYFLYRFTRAFGPASRNVERIVSTLTTLLTVWTLVLPHVPEEGEARPAYFIAYVVVFVIHWALLSVVVAARLWRAGRAQPTVARRRMHLLSAAAAALTLAIVLSALNAGQYSGAALASGILAFLSGLGFLLGLVPPALLRFAWRRPEQDRLQQAIGDLMTIARTEEEVVERVLSPMADIVGARALAIRDEGGRLVGAHNLDEERLGMLGRGETPGRVDGDEVLEVEMPSGSLLIWTTPYAPFFGDEELRLLRNLGTLTALALDRGRLFAQEHEARVALEHANELKSNFVALAAHELRTPVTAINGFIQTLVHRRDQIDASQRLQLEETLDQQGTRLALLVEQLLDLSRLDAEAVRIEPRPLPVRARVIELLDAVAADRAGDVRLEVPPELETEVDPAAFDRIVSNLVVNALRYGQPPVIVQAKRSDRHFRLTVEDRGVGVPPDLVPDLFERFTRGQSSRERTIGSGLGLAIARSYARAHRGDLLYEPAEPQGARFQLVLPAEWSQDVELHRLGARVSLRAAGWPRGR